MRSQLIYPIAFLLLGLAAACTYPERKTFAELWKTAVETKDARLAWSLLDSASHTRIIAGIKRSQEKAKESEDFRQLFSFVNAPADLNLPTEDLAIELLRQQLAGKENQIVDDGKTTLIHLESRGWVTTVEPFGFSDPDGVPLCLLVRLPSENGSRATPSPSATQSANSSEIPGFERGASISLNYHPAWAGKTASEMSAVNSRAAGTMAEKLGLHNNFQEWLTKIMDNYHESLGRGLNDLSFDVDASGGVTRILTFSRPGQMGKPERQPLLAFGAWPAANVK